MNSTIIFPFETYLDLEITLTAARTRLASISTIADDQLQLMIEDDLVSEDYTTRMQALMYLTHDLKDELQEVVDLIEKGDHKQTLC